METDICLVVHQCVLQPYHTVQRFRFAAPPPCCGPLLRSTGKAVNKLTVTLMGGWVVGATANGHGRRSASETELVETIQAIGLDMLGMFCCPVLGGNMCRKFTPTHDPRGLHGPQCASSCFWPQILNN